MGARQSLIFTPAAFIFMGDGLLQALARNLAPISGTDPETAALQALRVGILAHLGHEGNIPPLPYEPTLFEDQPGWLRDPFE